MLMLYLGDKVTGLLYVIEQPVLAADADILRVCDVRIIQAIGINGVYLGKHICAANICQPGIVISNIYYKTKIDLMLLNKVVIVIL